MLETGAVRTIRLFLRDRGLATPLIVLLVQLVLLQAGGRAVAGGAMAAPETPASWCLSIDDETDDVPARAPCPCALLCAAQVGAGHLVVSAGDAVLVVVTRHALERTGPVIADLDRPRALSP